MGSDFLIVGCGGVGGVTAAHLVEAGHRVTGVTTNAGILAAVRDRGFQIRGDGGSRQVEGEITSAVPDRKYDYVVLATQPPDVERAARAALPALGKDGLMVCFQNGLCEARVAAIAGTERVVGAVVAWGAAMPEPGVYDRTAAGGFAIGRLDGKADARLDTLARAFEAIGPVEITSNLQGKRWSKLAINCAISALGTIAGDRLGPLLQHRFVRRLALEIMTEAVLVARRENVRLEKVAGTFDLSWMALTDEERVSQGSPSLVAKHAMLLAVGLRYRRMRSSMLAAIERGRTPAVDFLNGEVVDRARSLGVPAPFNTRARELVWDIAEGKNKPGFDLLRELSLTPLPTSPQLGGRSNGTPAALPRRGPGRRGWEGGRRRTKPASLAP
jgi:2-dehydropantoate 2-reductase